MGDNREPFSSAQKKESKILNCHFYMKCGLKQTKEKKESEILKGEIMSTTQEITARVSKTIQEQQFEPLTAEVIIRETCPKKKYDERLAELLAQASDKVFEFLGDESDQPEGEELQGQHEEGGPLDGGEGFEGSEGGKGELDLGTVDISGEEGGEGAIAGEGEYEEGGEGAPFENGGEGGGFEGGEEGGFENGFEGGEEGAAGDEEGYIPEEGEEGYIPKEGEEGGEGGDEFGDFFDDPE